jgi:hypothetical protein
MDITVQGENNEIKYIGVSGDKPFEADLNWYTVRPNERRGFLNQCEDGRNCTLSSHDTGISKYIEVRNGIVTFYTTSSTTVTSIAAVPLIQCINAFRKSLQ